MLRGNALSEPASLFGASDCIFSNGIVINDLGAFRTFHHDGCGEHKDDANSAQSRSCID